MSLILDALNRSRANTDEVPDLATQHYVENSAGGSRRRQYLPWLALLVSLLVIGWLVLDRRPPPSSVADTATITPIPTPTPEAQTAQAAAIVRTPAPTTIKTQESPPVQAQPVTKLTLIEEKAEEKAEEMAETEAGKVVEQKVEEETVAQTQLPQDDSAVADLYRQHPDPKPITAKPTVQAEPEPTARSRVAPAVAERPAVVDVAEASREEQPIDIEQVILKARNELENARLEEHSAPFIADLSQQTKDSIPTIFYERHDYSDDKSQSSVVCNGKSLKVGGSPAAGVKVDEILPDSVVLSYRGTQFRLRALNSWVNL
jgi:hypothetical protein